MTFTEFTYALGAFGLTIALLLSIHALERRSIAWREADRRGARTEASFRQVGDLSRCVVVTYHQGGSCPVRVAVGGRVFGFANRADMGRFLALHGHTFTDPRRGAEAVAAFRPSPVERITELTHPAMF